MLELDQLSGYISEQNKKRELWQGNDDPEDLTRMIKEEAIELEESIQKAMIDDNVFEVASEIGDVGYLLLNLCNSLGINLAEAIEMKVVRNSLKYPDHIMSNGRDYKHATQVSKESWQRMGGDAAFSHIYLDYFAVDDDISSKYPTNLFGESDGRERETNL